MGDPILKKRINERYDAADRWLVQKRVVWTQYEDLFHNKLADALSQSTKSQVFDPILSTLALERSYRVMAQLASGKVRGVGSKAEGAARIMDLALDKYITPNATAQFDLLTKYRMVDTYSNIYGNFFAMVDWDVKPNGYIGPDMWLIPIRDVFPQVGAISVKDSDYIIIQSWQPLSYFERLAEQEDQTGLTNLPAIIEKLKDQSGDKQARNVNHMDNRELEDYPGAMPSKGDGYFQVLSMYEKDRWVDFCVKADMEFRDTENPHDNGELPVVNKYAIPLLEDFMGMGDFERGKSMQLTQNSLWNLYLDAVKVSIFPPVIINKQAIADKSSIKWSAAAKWLVTGNPTEAASVMSLSPQGTQTFNNVQTAVKTSLLNMFGSTDTTVNQHQDPGFGRTPQALQMQTARQNSADTADRYYMESFVNDVTRKFVNLMAKKSDKIEFDMFSDEIDEIGKEYPEIQKMFDDKTGKLTLENTDKNTIYTYEMVPGSTYQTDQQQQQQNLLSLFNMIAQGMQLDPTSGEPVSPLMKAMEAEGKQVNIGELMTRLISNSGISDWDKIIVDKNNRGAAILAEHQAKFQAAVQAMKMGIPPGQPQQPGQQQGQPQPGQQQGQQMTPKEFIDINYKDAPPDIQRQMEQAAGFQPSQVGNAQANMQVQQGNLQQQMALQQHQQQMAQGQLQQQQQLAQLLQPNMPPTGQSNK